MRRLGCLLGLALVCGCAETPPGGSRNVVLISIDTLRADALGAYTPGLATSPAIDRLAREGWLFEQVSAPSPSTLPSHASIFTGREPFVHGVRSNAGYALPASEHTLAEAFQKAGYATGAEVAAAVIARRTGLEQGFEHYRDPEASDARHVELRLASGGLRRLPERPADDISDRGIEFLRRHRDQPFFLWLHYFDPHVEYTAPGAFAARFPARPYHAEVAYADAAVGRVIEALEELGLAQGTLVALTSDHGEGLGEHGEDTHSFLTYQSTLRVPLIFWGPPELPRGVRVAAPASSIDIAPTLLAWAGLPALEGARGRPLQEHGPVDEARPVYSESFEAHSAFGASALRSLRQGDWKYIHQSRPELYHLGEDPGEQRDRAGDEPQRREALHAALAELLESAPEPAPESVTPLDPDRAAQLAALGYAAAPPRPGAGGERLEARGPDPRELLDDLDLLAAAGRAFGIERDYEGAAKRYAELARRHPDGLLVLRGWIDALRALGRNREQLPLLERAVGLAPGDAALRLKWVEALEADGDLEAATREAMAAHARRPCGELEIAYVSRVLRAARRFETQRDALRHSMARCGSDGARNELAWFLATCPEAALRDGEEALRLSRELAEQPGRARPAFVDTLAAALAEIGQPAEAARIQRRAIAQLEARDADANTLAEFRAHLARFEAGLPVRDPPGPGAEPQSKM